MIILNIFIFSFTSEVTIAVVILQKNDASQGKPIALFSTTLWYIGLKYNIMDKQACALVKALKPIRYYGMHSNIIAYVPRSTIKDNLCQLDSEGRRGRWISK